MDSGLKRCGTFEDVQFPSLKRCRNSLPDPDPVRAGNLIASDELSRLPDELLGRILSFLPSKDAVCSSLLLGRMFRVFPWITNIDLDDSTIIHCLQRPHLIHRFPIYTTFVSNVLQACQSVHHLRRFRLAVAGYKSVKCFDHRCQQACLPDLEPVRLNAWISFPLARIGLRELDLCIHVRSPDGKLPPAVFSCETLEVLKLHMNLDVDPDSPFCLPNLKLLHLASFTIPEDDFITRLVSSCPLLEDLAIDSCLWYHANFITISSPTLLTLFLDVNKRDFDALISIDIVTIDTPNLRYLRYYDDLARQYRVTQMNHLVEAAFYIHSELQRGDDHLEASFQSMISLIRPASNVQHLSLTGASLEVLEEGDLKDQMPMFHHLKHLVLGYDLCKWDKVLMGILNYTPQLETLTFPEGVARNPDSETEAEELERVCWRKAQAIPSCYRLHLKEVVINEYIGVQRELELIKFILRNASVLEKMVVRRKVARHWVNRSITLAIVDQKSTEKTLRVLPKASNTCLIQVE